MTEALEPRLLLSVSAVQMMSETLGPVIADPDRNFVYLVDNTNSRILEIDTGLGKTVAWTPFIGTANDIAVDGADDQLWLANGTDTLQKFSLPTLAALPSVTVPVPLNTTIAAGTGYRLYVAGGTDDVIDANTGDLLSTFAKADSGYDTEFRTNPNGTILYGTSRSLSGGNDAVDQWDISGTTPVLTASYPIPQSNPEDFDVDPTYGNVYWAEGGVYELGITYISSGQQTTISDGGGGGSTAIGLNLQASVFYDGSFSNIREYDRSNDATVADFPLGGGVNGAELAETPNGNAIALEANTVMILGSGNADFDDVPSALFSTQNGNDGAVQFNASASQPYESDEDIVRYAWTFGDGATATGVDPSHTFATNGNYNVTLTVTSDSAESDSVTKAITISDSGVAGLAAPTGVIASSGTLPGKVRIDWDAVSGAQNYQIFRGTTSDLSDAALIASQIVGTTYRDMTALPGVGYFYWVRARNSTAGPGAYGGPAAGFRPLPAPAGLGATLGTQAGRVRLNWSAVVGATSYQIWRSTSSDVSTATQIASQIAVTNYRDLTATPGTVYYYWVRGRNGTGPGAFAGPAQGSSGALTDAVDPSFAENASSALQALALGSDGSSLIAQSLDVDSMDPQNDAAASLFDGSLTADSAKKLELPL